MYCTHGCFPASSCAHDTVATISVTFQRADFGHARDPDGWGRGRLIHACIGKVPRARRATKVFNNATVAEIAGISDLESSCQLEGL